MSDKSSVSAVMFVYNEAEFIGEQLESILRQSTLPDKVIVVDDQSTDNTKDIVEKYIHIHPQMIEYYYNPVKGKVNALELGLSKVKTDYYFVCAGDDILSKDYVEINLQLLHQKGIEFIYNSFREFYQPYVERELPQSGNESIQEFRFNELLLGNQVHGYIFASSKIINILCPLAENLPFEDWYIAFKLCKIYGSCPKNLQPTFLYRKHTGSDSANFQHSKEKFIFLIQRDKNLFQFMLKDPVFSESEKKLFRQKVLLFENMLSYNPIKMLQILGSRHLSGREKFKSVFYPFIKKMKYRN